MQVGFCDEWKRSFNIYSKSYQKRGKQHIFLHTYRGHPGSRMAGPLAQKHMIKLEDSPSGYVRPSIVNEEDIRAMDSGDVDDGGWAGAQEEIDYSVKLNFDDDEPPSPVADVSGKSLRGDNKPPQQGERVMNGDMNNRTQVC